MMARLGNREPSMRLALDLLEARGGRSIVETGCAHNPGDWSGAGLSTVVFGDWASRNGGSVATIDIDRSHLDACRTIAAEYDIVYVEADSVTVLAGWAEPIDLLYLDSFDYPYGSLLDEYGGRTDLGAAIVTLAAMTEAEIVSRHGEVIEPAQRHCKREIQAALPVLHVGSVVVFDDAGLPGGGKPRLAHEVLRDDGWTCLFAGYQTVWTR